LTGQADRAQAQLGADQLAGRCSRVTYNSALCRHRLVCPPITFCLATGVATEVGSRLDFGNV